MRSQSMAFSFWGTRAFVSSYHWGTRAFVSSYQRCRSDDAAWTRILVSPYRSKRAFTLIADRWRQARFYVNYRKSAVGCRALENFPDCRPTIHNRLDHAAKTRGTSSRYMGLVEGC